MRRPLCVLLLAFTFVLSSSTAFARSGQVWSEKSASSPTLVTGNDYSTLAEEVIPAVVSISIRQQVKTSQYPSQQDPFEYFHRFFGLPGPRGGHPQGRQQAPLQGIGTGFVVSSEGLILTNNHVVENADLIKVTFMNPDGSERTQEATVLGTAPEYDIALIQTTENAKASITYLGDSDKMKIGHSVMAVGNPFGLSHSVSVGIISAKERRDIAPSGRHGLYNFIQTDASINPGNSGGPLINMRGEVIGINTAINSAGSGIGFAIPINMVKEMIPQLRSKGKYSRSWIGIRIQSLTAELAQTYGLSSPHGALVSEVIPEGPAAEAGIQDGDIILEFDRKTVRTSRDLPLYAGMAGVGNRVPVKVWREGRERTYKILLKPFPNSTVALNEENKEGEKTGGIGITVANITPDLQRDLQLTNSHGVVIKEVEPGSVAARSGLQPGDVLLRLNGAKIKHARGFAHAVRKIASGGVMRLQISSRRGRLFLALKKP